MHFDGVLVRQLCSWTGRVRLTAVWYSCPVICWAVRCGGAANMAAAPEVTRAGSPDEASLAVVISNW